MSVDRFIAIAAGAVGLTQDDAAFRVLCGPGETEQRQRELAGLSTCALFLRGCLAFAAMERNGRHIEFVPPRLWAPYVTGRAMADLIAVCESVRVIPHLLTRSVTEKAMLRPGALVIVGTGNNLHVYLVESIESDGYAGCPWKLRTIEAGQVDGDGRQRVERKLHEIDSIGIDRITLEQDHASGAWVPSSVGPCPRPVAYVLSAEKLLEGT